MFAAPLLLAALVAAAGSGPAADEAAVYDERLLHEVAKLAPAEVEEARVAAEAYHAGRWQEAFDRYERVVAAAPAFSHGYRRQCVARRELGDRAAALPLCRKALAVQSLPENQLALAMALADVPGGGTPAEADRLEALRLAREAFPARPADVTNAQMTCVVALRSQDDGLLQACSDRLLGLAPDDVGTRYFATISALTRGNTSAAREHLRRARAAGMPAPAAERLSRVIDGAEPLHVRYGLPAAAIAAGWALGLLLLLGVGAALSGITLRAAARIARSPAGEPAGGSRLLRSAYAAVLGLSCAYYYLSIPLVLVAVIALGGGALYGLLAVGHVPVKLLLLIAIVVLVTVWAVLKALWVSVFRTRDADPGARIAAGTHPRLDAALAAVAGRIGTRPVDAVFLTPGTQVAVFERGSLLRQLSGRSERCLILGVGVLDGMTRGQLEAVLAHEYGHLVNRDTAGGGLALAVRRSIQQMAMTLAGGGAAAWYNPAWLFVTGFHRIFLRVSQGASRLQEILADRWAARACGGRAFAEGLRHVIERSIRFDRHAQASLREVVEGERALANLYRYAPAAAVDEAAVAVELEQALAAPPSPYDSHPRPNDRIAWVGALAPAEPPGPDASEPAWALFADREAVERQMTDEVRAVVERRNGVRIPVEPPAPPEAATGT
jgi:Zn-dependent protease with chaperone function